jgi:hypothetical protein
MSKYLQLKWCGVLSLLWNSSWGNRNSSLLLEGNDWILYWLVGKEGSWKKGSICT